MKVIELYHYFVQQNIMPTYMKKILKLMLCFTNFSDNKKHDSETTKLHSKHIIYILNNLG